MWGERLIVLLTLFLIYRQGQRSETIQAYAEKLLLSEKQQRNVLDILSKHLPLKMWRADSSGNLVHASKHFVEFTGVPEQEILADWPSFLHPEDRELIVESWAKSVEQGKPFIGTFRLRQSNGRYLWHKTQASPVFGPRKDRPESWLGSAYNIDDLVQLRERADDLASRLRQTIDSITDAFLTLDADFRITYINRKAAEIFGPLVDNLLGKTVWEIGADHPDSDLGEHLRRCMSNRQEAHFETRYPPGGKWFDVRVYASSPGLTIYLLDITESKHEKEQLSLLNNAVSRLNDIVQITEAAPLDDPGPKIVFVNDAFERKTGYTRSETIGKSPRILQGPGTQRAELARIREALEQERPVRSQLLNYTKAGEEIWLELEIVPVSNEHGEITHFIAVERDISEQRVLEHQLAVAQRMESIGQLTGGVAHDFNNLLGVIIGNADLLQSELEKRETWDLSGLVDLIVKAAERGAALTQNMLAFARRQPLHPKRTDVNELVKELVPILRSSAGEWNTLNLTPDYELWPVEIDAAQLENSLINLTLNARDAMPGGGVITIELSNTTVDEMEASTIPGLKAGEYVLIRFSDNGAGMSAETQARAFEPFYTTKEKQGGTGLGLSTTYGFIKQSGGFISVSSEPGEGTSFEIYLRRANSLAGGGVEPCQSAEDLNKVYQKRRTVLVVEDNRDLQRINVMALESANFRALTASNVTQALDKLDQNQDIDLVLSDIVMPGQLSGIDLAERMGTEHPAIPIILTSGYSELGELSGDDRWRRFPFLKKPYRPKELLVLISKVIGEFTEDR